MKKVQFEELDPGFKSLLEAAGKAAATAYNPYSHFAVGAALLTDSGEVITGSNIENASYGLTICAERTALARANTEGYRKFKAIAVIAAPEEEAISPCGACRQMLYEASLSGGGELKIILSNTDKTKIILTSISELLPLPFGPNRPGKD